MWSLSTLCVPFFISLLALEEAIQRASGEEIIIPFGVGIAGAVAETKSTIKIQNAYEDPRFNCEMDQKTGYKTNNMLSMAISNYEGDVIGVAQIINKPNGKCEWHCSTNVNELGFLMAFFNWHNICC